MDGYRSDYPNGMGGGWHLGRYREAHHLCRQDDNWFPFSDEQIAVFGELFGNAYSASMTVGAEFPTSNVHVEIDAIAVLPPPDGQ